MGYENCGKHPNSKAALNKGMNVQKLMRIDTKTQELANSLLNEIVEYNGAKITRREALLREQLERAQAGELRACQFLIELAGHSEQEATAGKPEELSPLEELYAKMRHQEIDDRRRKTLREEGST